MRPEIELEWEKEFEFVLAQLKSNPSDPRWHTYAMTAISSEICLSLMSLSLSIDKTAGGDKVEARSRSDKAFELSQKAFWLASKVREVIGSE